MASQGNRHPVSNYHEGLQFIGGGWADCKAKDNLNLLLNLKFLPTTSYRFFSLL